MDDYFLDLTFDKIFATSVHSPWNNDPMLSSLYGSSTEDEDDAQPFEFNREDIYDKDEITFSRAPVFDDINFNRTNLCTFDDDIFGDAPLGESASPFYDGLPSDQFSLDQISLDDLSMVSPSRIRSSGCLLLDDDDDSHSSSTTNKNNKNRAAPDSPFEEAPKLTSEKRERDQRQKPNQQRTTKPDFPPVHIKKDRGATPASSTVSGTNKRARTAVTLLQIPAPAFTPIVLSSSAVSDIGAIPAGSSVGSGGTSGRPHSTDKKDKSREKQRDKRERPRSSLEGGRSSFSMMSVDSTPAMMAGRIFSSSSSSSSSSVAVAGGTSFGAGGLSNFSSGSGAGGGKAAEKSGKSSGAPSSKMSSRIYAFHTLFSQKLPDNKPEFLSDIEWVELLDAADARKLVSVIEFREGRLSVRLLVTFDIIIHSLANYGVALKEHTPSASTRFRWWTDSQIPQLKVSNRNISKTVVERTVILPDSIVNHPYLQTLYSQDNHDGLFSEFTSFFASLLKRFLHPDDFTNFEEGAFGRSRKRPRQVTDANAAFESVVMAHKQQWDAKSNR